MSDQQQEEEEDLALQHQQHQQYQQQQFELETLENGTGVRVTNILDGFFTKFRRRGSLSNYSSAGSATSTNNSNPQVRAVAAATSRRPFSSSFLRRTNSTGSNSNHNKRVKFHEHEQQHHYESHQVEDEDDDPTMRRINSGNNPNNNNDLSSAIMADESELSYSARSNNSMDASSGGGMDASASSQASWGVRTFEAPTTTTQAAKSKQLNSFLNRELLAGEQPDPLHDNNHNNNHLLAPPKWFEQYMPNFVIQIRAFCGLIVLDDRFQIIMILLILANAITMGIATFDFVYYNETIQDKFEIVDQAFLIVFTIELILQFGYWGYQLFFDGWLLFDFITIVMSWWLEGVQVFRSFRIFRSFRLVVRIPILKSLVYAVFHVLPRISSIMMLFALILYIYAVMCTTLFGDLYKNGFTTDDYFGRLDHSLFTLFQFVTLENWGEIAREVGEQHYYAYGLFGSFLTITGFILYSLVVAVVCDSFLMVESKIRKEIKEQAKLDRQRRRSTMKAKRRKAKRGSSSKTDAEAEGQDTETSMRDDSDNKMEDNIDENQQPTNDDSTPKKKKKKGKRKKTSDEVPPPPPEESSSPKKNKKKSSSSQQLSPARKTSLATTPAKDAVPPMTFPDDEDGNPSAGGEMEVDDDDDYTDHLPDPLTTTLTTSPETLTTTATTTLVAGELEHHRRRRRKNSSKKRIQRVQQRLDTLANKQSEILETLGSLCSQVEKYNSRHAGGGDTTTTAKNAKAVVEKTQQQQKQGDDDDDIFSASIDAMQSDIEDGHNLLNQVGSKDSGDNDSSSSSKFKKIKVKMPHNL